VTANLNSSNQSFANIFDSDRRVKDNNDIQSINMLAWILSWFPDIWLRWTLRTSGALLYPKPDRITLSGEGPTFTACKWMLSYAGMSWTELTGDFKLEVVSDEGDYDEFVSPTAIVLYLAKICMCLPSSPLLTAKATQLSLRLPDGLNELIALHNEHAGVEGWMLGLDAPSVVDFMLCAHLVDKSESLPTDGTITQFMGDVLEVADLDADDILHKKIQ
jgi:hypothetical protein